MNCSFCGTPGTAGYRCSTCGRLDTAAARRPSARTAVLSIGLVVLLVGGAVVVHGSSTVAGSPVPAAVQDTAARAAAPDRIVAPVPSSTAAAPDSPENDEPDVAPTVGLAYELGGLWPGSFNQLAADGAARAEADHGIELIEVEPTADDDLEQALVDLVEQGADPVIAVGYSWEEALSEVAPQFPDTAFVVLDGYVEEPNVRSLLFSEEEGAFLVGAAAALKSAGGRIGFLGASDDWYTAYYRAGFVAGATAVNPDIDVTVDYLGREYDPDAWAAPDAAKRVSGQWYADGIDVVFSPSGLSSDGVIDAAIDAGAGHWYIGSDYDEYVLAGIFRGQVVLTSMVKRYDVLVELTVAAAVADDLDSLPDYVGLADGGVGYVTSGNHIDDIVPELDEWSARIASGAIIVPYE